MRFSILLLFVGVSLAGLHPSHAQEVATDFETAYRWYTESLNENDNESALRHSQTAYELGLEKFGSDGANVAILAYNYSKLLSLLQDRKQAAAMATVARETAERAHGEISAQVFDLLQWEGKAHLTIYEHDFATELADRLIEMAVDLFGIVSVEHANSLAFAANAGTEIGWDRRSRDYFENALDIYLQTVGETDARTARVKFDLGRYHAAWRRHKRAIEYYHNAIDIWSLEKTKHLIEIGTARSFLVTSYSEIGEIEKATEQCKAVALDMVERGGDDGEAEVAPLFRKSPRYPNLASSRPLGGWVHFSFTIDANGFVRGIEIEDSVGHKQLQRAAKRH